MLLHSYGFTVFLSFVLRKTKVELYEDLYYHYQIKKEKKIKGKTIIRRDMDGCDRLLTLDFYYKRK